MTEDLEFSERSEERRVIEVEGVEFYVEDLVRPLGWLKRGEVEDEIVDTSTLRRMKEAGLVQKKTEGGFMSMSEDDPTTKWKPIDGKCQKLFNQLNEPYYRLRPKIDHGETPSAFGMWDEQEDENAREKAQEKVEELNERNPDVTFKLDKEKLNCIPTRK
jgi:hypothetical protein